jgi:hypothetical protein
VGDVLAQALLVPTLAVLSFIAQKALVFRAAAPESA